MDKNNKKSLIKFFADENLKDRLSRNAQALGVPVSAYVRALVYGNSEDDVKLLIENQAIKNAKVATDLIAKGERQNDEMIRVLNNLLSIIQTWSVDDELILRSLRGLNKIDVDEALVKQYDAVLKKQQKMLESYKRVVEMLSGVELSKWQFYKYRGPVM